MEGTLSDVLMAAVNGLKSCGWAPTLCINKAEEKCTKDVGMFPNEGCLRKNIVGKTLLNHVTG
jgi:hypothetical protein